MTMFHVFDTMSTAAAVLSAHFRSTQKSMSCMLFFSVMIRMSSSVITNARITPAMGSITLIERLRIILYMPLFHACGDVPTCAAISETRSFTESNIPVRLAIIPLVRISLIQSFIQSATRRHPPLYSTSPRRAGTCQSLGISRKARTAAAPA